MLKTKIPVIKSTSETSYARVEENNYYNYYCQSRHHFCHSLVSSCKWQKLGLFCAISV